jgi:FixJ family two-component response regulator
MNLTRHLPVCSPLAHSREKVQRNIVRIDLTGGAQMTENSIGDVLALIPQEMKQQMRQLRVAVAGALKVCNNPDDFALYSRREMYAVVLIPASLPTHQWWSLWGLLSSMEPQPSILVYTLNSDFPMWSGVLEAGGFDVLVAPFTETKLRTAVESAANYFYSRPKQ